MKTLLLMRHAKSSWKDNKTKDRERPLNKRGRHDAPIMGQILADHELVPQAILSSSAERARETAEALAKTSHFDGDVIYLDKLYMGEPEDYIETLRDLPNEVERVMVIGHNPGLEMLLQLMSGQIQSMPTAVIAHLVLPVDHWSELSMNTSGEVVDIWRPKEVSKEVAKEAAEELKEEKGKSKSKKSKSDEKPKKKDK